MSAWISDSVLNVLHGIYRHRPHRNSRRSRATSSSVPILSRQAYPPPGFVRRCFSTPLPILRMTPFRPIPVPDPWMNRRKEYRAGPMHLGRSAFHPVFVLGRPASMRTRLAASKRNPGRTALPWNDLQVPHARTCHHADRFGLPLPPHMPRRLTPRTITLASVAIRAVFLKRGICLMMCLQ